MHPMYNYLSNAYYQHKLGSHHRLSFVGGLLTESWTYVIVLTCKIFLLYKLMCVSYKGEDQKFSREF
jgi:hypothetical protein